MQDEIRQAHAKFAAEKAEAKIKRAELDLRNRHNLVSHAKQQVIAKQETTRKGYQELEAAMARLAKYEEELDAAGAALAEALEARESSGCTRRTAVSESMQQGATRRRHRDEAVAMITLLEERFPACFAVLERRRRPLKIGIHQDIIAAVGVAPAELGRALQRYTRSDGYLRQAQTRRGADRSRRPCGRRRDGRRGEGAQAMLAKRKARMRRDAKPRNALRLRRRLRRKCACRSISSARPRASAAAFAYGLDEGERDDA